MSDLAAPSPIQSQNEESKGCDGWSNSDVFQRQNEREGAEVVEFSSTLVGGAWVGSLG